MNIILMLAIFLANTIAVLLIYQFIKRQEKREQILFMAISIATVYIAVSIIYWLSGIGIDSNINDAAKNFIVFLFVPIDVILLVPFIATKYIKYRNKKITKREYLERVIKVCLIGIVLLGLECGYMRHIKQNIGMFNIYNEQNNKQENDIITEETKQQTNTITNETIDDIMTNETTNSNSINANEINSSTVKTNTVSTNSIDN